MNDLKDPLKKGLLFVKIILRRTPEKSNLLKKLSKSILRGWKDLGWASFLASLDSMLEKNHESPSWLVSGLEKRTILSDSFKRGLNRFVLLVLFSMYLLNISAGIVPLLCRLEFTSRCHW